MEMRGAPQRRIAFGHASRRCAPAHWPSRVPACSSAASDDALGRGGGTREAASADHGRSERALRRGGIHPHLGRGAPPVSPVLANRSARPRREPGEQDGARTRHRALPDRGPDPAPAEDQRGCPWQNPRRGVRMGHDAARPAARERRLAAHTRRSPRTFLRRSRRRAGQHRTAANYPGADTARGSMRCKDRPRHGELSSRHQASQTVPRRESASPPPGD
jgi:hypothetical protein